MEISTTKKYTHILVSEGSYSNFYNTFINQGLNKVSNHKIVQLSENLNTTVKDLSLLLDIANTHRANGMSFVVICNGIDIDEIPDEINVVPTLKEAEDVLEMEEIERDLGF